MAGIAVGLAPTLGLQTVDAGRGVSVATAGDGTALIALEPTGTTVDSTDGQAVARLRNNVDQQLTVKYDVAVDSSALFVESTDGTRTLDRGASEPITVACRGADGANGTARLSVVVSEATAAGLRIENAILTTTVQYDCPSRSPPGDTAAYNDADGDGQYDEGETAYTAEQLRTFDNESVDLVVADAGTIDTGYRQLSVHSKTITVRNTTLSSDDRVALRADGAVTIENATVDSEYGEVRLTGSTVRAANATISTDSEIRIRATSGRVDLDDAVVESQYGAIRVRGPSISARSATLATDSQLRLVAESGTLDLAGAALTTQYGDVRLRSAGDTILTGATITTGSGQASATFDVGSATLVVDGLAVADADATLVYSPRAVTVTGTPSEGSVTAG